MNIESLAKLSSETSLNLFYSKVIEILEAECNPKIIEIFARFAPFVRSFQSKFVNYYGLPKIKALGDEGFTSRLEEFYSTMGEVIQDKGVNGAIEWLLDQTLDGTKKMFPNNPVPINYQDIMRSLSTLTELIRTFADDLTDNTYEKLFAYAEHILSPNIDKEYEEECKNLLADLNDIDGKTADVGSPVFVKLNDRINHINSQISKRLMSNNSFVSIVQQVSDINTALKCIRRNELQKTLDGEKGQLEDLWQGLKEFGLSGDDNYLQGDLISVKRDVFNWVKSKFPDNANQIQDAITQRYEAQELTSLAKENIPDAIYLYAINLIGTMGLRTEKSISLVLSYHSKFVEKMVREGALSVLRKNKETVQEYFLKSLGETGDYDLKVQIADTHDSVFSHIDPVSLTVTFGHDFLNALTKLQEITQPDGILLSNFIRSAYLKIPTEKSPKHQSNTREHLIEHFEETNSKLWAFRQFVEKRSQSDFISLIRMWGLNYVVSWSLTDYENEQRLFSFIIEAARDYPFSKTTTVTRTIPMQDVVMLLSQEPDAKQLIQKLMTFLLNSKISFDYRLFSSLFRVVAQRKQQLSGGITIRDGFSEQRGYSQIDSDGGPTTAEFKLQDPHIYHPIVIFLITVLNMKFINIPKDAFVETDISLYLNSLAEKQQNPELGYQMHLAHQLISSIPYIKDFSSHHETIIRKTIADLDESYKRENVLYHYHRIKIHRAPSKLDLDFCLEILDGLSSKKLEVVLNNLKKLMKGIGDEAIPDMEHFFEYYEEKLNLLGKHLRNFKSNFPDKDWQDIGENESFTKVLRDLPNIDADSSKDIDALIRLVNALSNYWTQRINDTFLDSFLTDIEKREFKQASLVDQLGIVKQKRAKYQKVIHKFDPNLEPYQHIFLKRHVIQGDWNFDFFGFWPYYKESKFEAYNADRKLAVLERTLLESRMKKLEFGTLEADSISDDTLKLVRLNIAFLSDVMIHLVEDGLAPSKYFMDTIDIFEKDQLTISQLHDIIGILAYRELAHIDSFIATTYGHFPAQIVSALGRENLDFGLDKLQVADEELLSPLVQETVLGNIIAQARPIHLLESHLNKFLEATTHLKNIEPSRKIFGDHQRPPRVLSPVYCGYKSYALQTMAADGFNIPSLETLPVDFFQSHLKELESGEGKPFKDELITRILILEEKTKKAFDFKFEALSKKQKDLIVSSRNAFDFDTSAAPILLVSSRSGSYRSMPGILGTVLNIGFKDITAPGHESHDFRFDLNTYRMFLSTFGNVVFGINEMHFSTIVERAKKELTSESDKKIKWEDLKDEQILSITNQFKNLIEKANSELSQKDKLKLDWDDPLDLLYHATIGVWKSWDSMAAKKLRTFLDISADWKTPVTIMEMKQADRNSQSFSAILFSGDPQGKTNKPHGDVLFGRPGEDIASGLASEGTPLETLEHENPELYQQIADLLEEVKINKGHVNVDVEMVGEWDDKTQNMELFVVQERQMPLGTRGESEDYRLSPTDVLPAATGKGVNGGVQYGVFLDGVKQDYYQLKETVSEVRKKLGFKDEFHGPGIFLLMKYVTPEEALKMNIEGVDGVVTTKIGKSSHASISAKRDGKLFVCESSLAESEGEWSIENKPIKLGTSESPDVFTVVGNPKSVSPYSGNIYRGKMAMIEAKKKR